MCVPAVPAWLLGAVRLCLGHWDCVEGDVSVFSVTGSFPARQQQGPPRVSFAGLLPCLRPICSIHRHENNLLKGDDFAVIKEWVFSSERAVMMGVLFPITPLNFSCSLVSKSKAGDWQTVQCATESSSSPCSALH